MTKVQSELTEFEDRFRRIWVLEGNLGFSTGLTQWCADGTSFNHNPEDYSDEETIDINMFGYDGSTYRLVEYEDYVEFYAWCLNSHGSTQVYRMDKEEFLQEARKIALIVGAMPEMPDGHKDQFARLERFQQLWDAMEGKVPAGRANWH